MRSPGEFGCLVVVVCEFAAAVVFVSPSRELQQQVLIAFWRAASLLCCLFRPGDLMMQSTARPSRLIGNSIYSFDWPARFSNGQANCVTLNGLSGLLRAASGRGRPALVLLPADQRPHRGRRGGRNRHLASRITLSCCCSKLISTNLTALIVRLSG